MNWALPGRHCGGRSDKKVCAEDNKARARQSDGLRRRLRCVEGWRLGARSVAGWPQLHVSGCGLLQVGWLGPGRWAGVVLKDVWAGQTPRFRGHILESGISRVPAIRATRAAPAGDLKPYRGHMAGMGRLLAL